MIQHIFSEDKNQASSYNNNATQIKFVTSGTGNSLIIHHTHARAHTHSFSPLLSTTSIEFRELILHCTFIKSWIQDPLIPQDGLIH